MKMFLVFFFLLIATSAAHTPGAVTVDKYSFDKILRNFDIVFVKFDDKFLVINMNNLKNLLKVLLIQNDFSLLKFP